MINFNYKGLVVNIQKFGNAEFLIDVLTEFDGRWRGIYDSKKHIMLASYVSITWKSKSMSSLGKIKLDLLQESICIKCWHSPFLLAAINLMCSACLFIPERIFGEKDFLIFNKLLLNISMDNYRQYVLYWERYILYNYFDKKIDADDLKSHVLRTPELNTKIRNDFIKIHELLK